MGISSNEMKETKFYIIPAIIVVQSAEELLFYERMIDIKYLSN